MQKTIELKQALCYLDQNNYALIIMFLLGYIIFSFYFKSKNEISEEEKARKFRKSIKYFNKHLKDNEEFFFGNSEPETSQNY